MDLDLLQQILTALQQNNANLTNLVNSQNHQITQQLAAIQNLQAVPAPPSSKGKITKPEPYDGSVMIFLCIPLSTAIGVPLPMYIQFM